MSLTRDREDWVEGAVDSRVAESVAGMGTPAGGRAVFQVLGERG